MAKAKAKTLSAVEYLAKPDAHPPRPVCVLFGEDAFLRRHALAAVRTAVFAHQGNDFSLTAVDGREAVLDDVLNELATMAMFGGRRMVVVEDADDFVTRYRGELEDYVARPNQRSVLVLAVKKWAANTRLYKSVAAEGLAVDCTAPGGAALTRWLGDWARRTHDAQLAPAAAEMLVDLIGPELGLLDQEVAKLALLAGQERKITPELVTRAAGGWRAKTTWEMLDAVLDGNVPEALRQLDRILASGEQPIGLLAQMASQLRRMAAATRMVLRAEAAGRRIPLRQALQQAAVPTFVLEKAERQLRRLGRGRGAQLYRWLLEADLDLKGESQLPPRMVLERLIVRLAVPQEMLC